MRCRDAREALPEARLGLAPAVVRDAVLRHVARCPECAAAARAEAEMALDLAALGDEPCPAIDATARVMRAVSDAAPRAREPFPLREAAWATAALSAAALALVAGGIAMAPSFWSAVRQTVPGIVWAAALGLKVGRSLAETVAFLHVFLRAGLDLLAAASRLAVKAEPVARAAAAVCTALMLAVTTVIVRRDLRHRAARAGEE